jgi:nitrogen fixation-related uncharacterized protein
VQVAMVLFMAGLAMGLAAACVWAWGVHTGQFRQLENTKQQLFWPDLAEEPGSPSLAGTGCPREGEGAR